MFRTILRNIFAIIWDKVILRYKTKVYWINDIALKMWHGFELHFATLFFDSTRVCYLLTPIISIYH